MPARINRVNVNERSKERIKTALLLNRLQDHGLATVDTRTGILPAKSRMLTSQIKAVEVLLDRVMPRLQRTTVEGGENPLQQENRLSLDDKTMAAVMAAFDKKF